MGRRWWIKTPEQNWNCPLIATHGKTTTLRRALKYFPFFTNSWGSWRKIHQTHSSQQIATQRKHQSKKAARTCSNRDVCWRRSPQWWLRTPTQTLWKTPLVPDVEQHPIVLSLNLKVFDTKSTSFDPAYAPCKNFKNYPLQDKWLENEASRTENTLVTTRLSGSKQHHLRLSDLWKRFSRSGNTKKTQRRRSYLGSRSFCLILGYKISLIV